MPLNTSQIEDVFVTREGNVRSLLGSILNSNLSHTENEKAIVNTINQLLGQAKHRKEGLEYLLLILNNCSSDTVAKHALVWINHCVIKFFDDVLREQKLKTIASLIENAYDEADFNKKFVSEYISKVVDSCLETSHVNPYECKAALETLRTCMRYYPSWFTSHKQKIETFVLIFLDKENEELVRGAAEVFHYLQQVGGAGSEGINHKVNFTRNFHKLCSTVHDLFDKLFEGDTELFHNAASGDEVFEFEDVSQNVTSVVARRIRNSLTFIEFMIRTKFSVVKEIKPKKLLELITRGTSLHRCISTELKSLETYQSSLILTCVQVKLLRILRLFLIWLGTNSLPFSYHISKVLVDNLTRCQSCDCFKHESLYQENVYKAIEEWLKVSKSSLHSHFQEQLVNSIVKDITPVKSRVTLNIAQNASTGGSAKSKRKSMENKIIASGQTQRSRKLTLLEQTNGINSCKFALRTMKCLLLNCRLEIRSDLLKEVYKSVFDTIATLQISRPVHPYSDTSCQARLYEVLVAFYHQDQLSVLPPLQTTLDFLARGANNSNRFIASVCEEGLQSLEVLCQPVCPSLYGGKPSQAEDTSPQENGLVNNQNIEFSPAHSPEQEDTLNHESVVDSPMEDVNDEGVDVLTHEINEAENDNNTNIEIEQQADEEQWINSSQSDVSLVPNVDNDEDIDDDVVKEVGKDIVDLDIDQPPSKKHKPGDTDDDDVFEEKSQYNLRSRNTKNAPNTENIHVQLEPLEPTAPENTVSVEVVNESSDAFKASDVVIAPDGEIASNAVISDGVVTSDANVSDEPNNEVAEESELDDAFVDKVLDSFVDEVKEY